MGKTERRSNKKQKKHGRFYRLVRLVVVLVVGVFLLVAIARPFLPQLVRYYVNRVLDQSIAYRGKIGDVNLHLWRGAYTIHDIRIYKTTGDIPVPLFLCNRLELRVQWPALIYGRVVGEIEVEQPEINFVDSPNSGEGESGGGGPWLQIVTDLFPFKINSVQVHHGSVHFRTYSAAVPVDVYLSEVEASVSNLSNLHRSVDPLIATINVHGLAMDQAKFATEVKLDPTSYHPTFSLAMRLLNLDLTKLNDLTRAYAGFYVKHGWFDLVVQANAHDGQIAGSIKPLFRDMQIFDLVKDIKNDKDPLQFFWQALVGGAAAILSNQQRAQFGTLVPFTGTTSGPKVDVLGTLVNVLKNAFVRAYLPRLDQTQAVQDNDLHFGAPDLSDPISVGDDP